MTFTATDQINPTAPTPWQTLKRVGAAVAIGGIMFWVPSAIWHLVRAEDFRGRDVIGLTILVPLLMVATGRILQRRIPPGRAPHYMPVAACIGAWLFGPIYLLANMLASDVGSVPPPGGWMTAFFAFAIFPATTFSVSTYDGTLCALGLSTVFLILVAAAGLRGYPLKQVPRQGPDYS